MLLEKSYKVELNPTKDQKVLFEKSVGVSRFTYNWALEQRIKKYKESGKTLSEFEQHKILNTLSKTCSNCGAIYKELQLSEREWTCRSCGTLHNCDLNAAINLSKYAANLAGIKACGDQVRPVKKYKLSNGQGRRSRNLLVEKLHER